MGNATNTTVSAPHDAMGWRQAEARLVRKLIVSDAELREHAVAAKGTNCPQTSMLCLVQKLVGEEFLEIAGGAVDIALSKADADGNQRITRAEYDAAVGRIRRAYEELKALLKKPRCQAEGFQPGITMNLLGSDKARQCLEDAIRKARGSESKPGN